MVTCPSTNLQSRLNLAPDVMELVREPPAILVRALLGDTVVTHVQPI